MMGVDNRMEQDKVGLGTVLITGVSAFLTLLYAPVSVLMVFTMIVKALNGQMRASLHDVGLVVATLFLCTMTWVFVLFWTTGRRRLKGKVQ